MITAAHPHSGILVRGSRRPVLNIMRRGLRGLGNGGCMSGADFLAAMGGQASCDPRDSSCVMCNTQRANAISNLVDSGCVAPGTPISFSCDTSGAALNSFMNNAPLAVNATVGTGATAYVASGPTVDTSGTPLPPPPPTAPTTQAATTYALAIEQANTVAAQQTAAANYAAAVAPIVAATVVNPSPPSQSTATGTTVTSGNSAVSQANGATLTTYTGAAASSGDWFTDPTQELISGFPNWLLLAAGGVAAFALFHAGRR